MVHYSCMHTYTQTHTHLDALLLHSEHTLIESLLGRRERPSDRPSTSDVTHVAIVLTTCIHQHQLTRTDRDTGVGRRGEGGREGDRRRIRSGTPHGLVPTHSLQCLVVSNVVQAVGPAPSGHHWREGEPLCPLHLHRVLHDGLQLVFCQTRCGGLHCLGGREGGREGRREGVRGGGEREGRREGGREKGKEGEREGRREGGEGREGEGEKNLSRCVLTEAAN